MNTTQLEKATKTNQPDLSEKLNLLFIDPALQLPDSVHKDLETSFNLFQTDNIRQASGILSKINIQVVVCEETLTDGSGTDFMAKLKVSHPKIVRIISSSSINASAALNAVNTASIFKYLVKPWHDTIIETLKHAIDFYRTEVQNQFKDKLTGLKSTATILDILQSELKRCERYGSDLSLILIKILNPKQESDLHDFLIDRLLLQKIAEIMQFEVRGSDMGGHLTESNFLILLTETNEKGAIVFLNRFSNSVNKFDTEVNRGLLPFKLQTSQYTKKKNDKKDTILDVLSELYDRLP